MLSNNDSQTQGAGFSKWMEVGRRLNFNREKTLLKSWGRSGDWKDGFPLLVDSGILHEVLMILYYNWLWKVNPKSHIYVYIYREYNNKDSNINWSKKINMTVLKSFNNLEKQRNICFQVGKFTFKIKKLIFYQIYYCGCLDFSRTEAK